MEKIKVIGAGLAGCDCAYYLAEQGFKVELYDIKPNRFTPAHSNKNFGELVCSNSLKSNDVYGNACGLLKEEMRILGSMVISVADETKVDAGGALAVDRELFASKITKNILHHKNITFISDEVTSIPEGNVVIATGPLTLDKLANDISNRLGEQLYFFDAAAPIVSADSIDMSKAFIGDRYGKGNGDYINCPLTKEEYELFVNELCSAERATLHNFEKREIFESCMPVEIMASRGIDTLRFGMLKPVGLYDENGVRPYAVLQLRKENNEGSAYNLVGFQTNLKFAEQKRVFGIFPALKNAEFLRYGVMHRNTYINAPKFLNSDFSLKMNTNIYFAGQITGVEGYVESAMSGLLVAVHLTQKLKGKKPLTFDNKTICGALSNHISTLTDNFQPMNANYGILSELDEKIRDKVLKKRKMSQRALENIRVIKEKIEL